MRIDSPHQRADDAMRILASTPALALLTERGWLERNDGGWEMTDDRRAMLSTGESSLLKILAAIAEVAEHLTRLDSASRSSVKSAFGALFGADWSEPADDGWLSDVALVPLLDNESLMRGGVA